MKSIIEKGNKSDLDHVLLQRVELINFNYLKRKGIIVILYIELFQLFKKEKITMFNPIEHSVIKIIFFLFK